MPQKYKYQDHMQKGKVYCFTEYLKLFSQAMSAPSLANIKDAYLVFQTNWQNKNHVLMNLYYYKACAATECESATPLFQAMIDKLSAAPDCSASVFEALFLDVFMCPRKSTAFFFRPERSWALFIAELFADNGFPLLHHTTEQYADRITPTDRNPTDHTITIPPCTTPLLAYLQKAQLERAHHYFAGVSASAGIIP